MSGLASGRNVGVDLGRALACLFVIFLHQTVESYGSAAPVAIGLSALARWAVPFFFVMSGYFLAVDRPFLEAVRKTLVRLLPVFLFWLLVYVALSDDPLSHVDSPRDIARMLVFGSPTYHLWFLPSLGLCIVIVLVMRQLASDAVLVALAFVTFLFGLVLDPYKDVLFAPHVLAVLPDVDTRNGPFFGFVFISLGYILRKRETLVSLRNGVGLVIIGILLSAIELTCLGNLYEVGIDHFDFVLGTLPLGVGAALVFLSLDIRSVWVARVASMLGAVSLGIYGLHALVLRNLNWIIAPDSLFSGLAVGFLTMAISAGIALIAIRVYGLKRVFN